MEEQVCKI